MENPEENIFGKEHHEARAKRFIDDARKAAKEYKDLEIAVTNITEEELDMGPETELAAYLEGNEELAQLIPIAAREDIPGKECLAMYEFRRLASNS